MPFLGGAKLGKIIGKIINPIVLAINQYFLKILLKNYIFEYITFEGKIYE